MRRPRFHYQYEPLDIATYSEPESEQGAKMEGVTNPDVLTIWNLFHSQDLAEGFEWAEVHQKEASPLTYDIDTDNPKVFQALKGKELEFILNRRRLNTIYGIDDLLSSCNEALKTGGYLLCHARTSTLQRELILRKYPIIIRRFVIAHNYWWHRVCPKLPVLKRIYHALTGGKKRQFHRIEILGRISRAGFKIVDEEFLRGEFFVLGQKVRQPLYDDPPKCGPIIKLRRIGKGGQIIGVYKFRTMYSYSEYLQDYLYNHIGLQEGGKFKDDPRINFWGKILRSCWLDELPMFVNWFKRQLKLVGVRPLSQQYFSLYTPEMQALRIKVKPGLIPPFYYEKQSPKTIEEVQESERKYIEAYLAHPFRTDWKYFWGTIGNILFHHKKSN